MTVTDPPVTRDFNQSYAALHRRSGAAAPNPRRAGAQLHLGVTIVRLGFGIEVDYVMASGEAGVCIRTRQVRLDLRHVEHHVMIANEIPPRGCLFEEVLKHEMRHVAVNRETLAAFAPRVRAAVAEWSDAAAARAETAARAVQHLRRAIAAAARPELDALNAERVARHARIDTREEYRRLSASCFADHVRMRARMRGQAPPSTLPPARRAE